jgi:hypothetical protein
MSSDDDIDIKDILRRLDDLINVLKIISEDLTEITSILRSHVESKDEERMPFSAFKPTSQLRGTRTAEEVQSAFPKELLSLLLFEVGENYIFIKPKQYLGPENFARIASIVREQFGGEYVSQGKESHFRIPKII